MLEAKKNINNLLNIILVCALFFLAILIIKPIISQIILGILLAYIFTPLNKKISKKIKNKTLSAILVCVSSILIICIILGLILSSLISEGINIFLSLQDINFLNILQKILPASIVSSEFFLIIGNSIKTFISNIIADFFSSFGSFILNLPLFFLKFLVMVFIYFFCLKDGEKLIEYVKSLSPLKKDLEEKFFKKFKDITHSVLIGEVIIGLIQGLIAGIGYFLFGIPNAFLLTILTTFVGVIPVIGPAVIWIPIGIYLVLIGNLTAGIGILIYGIVIMSWLSVIIRPFIVSKKTKINSGILFIGMIGGLFVFGVLGLIIGPLVLSYILLIIEIYRKGKTEESLIFKKIE